MFLVAALVCMPLQSQAAYNMFLSLTGISGEATNGLIAVNSFSLGASVPVTNGYISYAGKVSFTSVNIGKPLDKSSPLLAYYCASGQHITTAKLTVVDQTSGIKIDSRPGPFAR